MCYYGYLLQKGEEIVTDKKESFRYFQMSAEIGDVDGMREYAKMLYFGDGVDKNVEEAKKYFEIASQKGDIESNKFLISIESEIND